MMDNSIKIPLDLPDVRVLEVSKTEEETWLIQVESTLDGTSCSKCGKKLGSAKEVMKHCSDAQNTR